MGYKVFISYTACDHKIAEAVKRSLNKSFRGEIEFFFAHHDIKSGDEWKEKIRSNLEASNAIISIITKNSIDKPWLFIEWSAFWIANKKFYILVTDDVKVTDLVQPMQERQLTFMTNIDTVKGLLDRLSDDAAYADVPFHMADPFVVSVKAALIEQEREFSEKTNARYKENLDLLPASDREKEEIAQYFLQNQDVKTFVEVTKRVKNMHSRANLAAEALNAGHPDACFEISKGIWSTAILSQLVIDYIENGFDDSTYVHEIIDDIVEKDQGQLRVLAIHLTEQGKDDSELFFHILEDFVNMAELRKVATHFIQNNKHESDTFYEILEKFTERNRAELRKVGSYFVRDGKYSAPAFETTMKTLIQQNQREAAKLIKELKSEDPALYERYKSQLTEQAAIDSLE